MLFKKPISNVEYSDIENLKKNQIAESEILDYKDMRIDDNNVVKEVTAFSNTRGGFLIFGIKETGKGGHPESINGIDDNVNLERLEQIIISNVRPRISVQIRKIIVPQSNKIILIIRIPEGQNQPYYNNVTNKYYKRYNFEAKEMDEHEIEALYQKRFFGVANLSKYIDEIILFKRSRLPLETSQIDGHIIITPLRVDDRIIDTSNKEQIDFDPNKIRLEPRPNDLYLHGSSKPSRYGVQWSDWSPYQNIEIHRNGLIHYMSNDYGVLDKESGDRRISDYILACHLLETIQFADIVYSKFDFTGKVRIILRVMNSANSQIVRGVRGIGIFERMQMQPHICDAEEVHIEREWDSWRLKEDYLEIGEIIMDEVSNYYGLWKSDMFKEENGVIEFSSKE